MRDLIERAKALNFDMHVNAHPDLIQAIMDGMAIYMDYIKTIPAVDARPVVRGEWHITDAYPHHVYCSVCHKTYIPNDRWQIWVDGDLPRNFCPNCGADMREGPNES